jgi:hypothetical protein
MSKAKKDKDQPVPKVKGWIGNKFVESAFVDKKPAFLVVDTETRKVSYKYTIQVEERVLRPLERHEYGYRPYEFTSEEIESLNSSDLTTDGIISEILR